MFAGFPEETIRFFLDLRLHNDVTFFHAHHDEYLKYVREPFYAFIEALAPTARLIADDIELRPDRCLARIHRDTRFSKDKSPYRDHLWLLIRRAGEPKETAVMYWFELSPQDVTWGLGFWFRNKPAMEELRRRMEKQPFEVLQALKKSGIPDSDLHIIGDRYRRMKPPDGLPAELSEIYQMKDVCVKRADAPLQLCYKPELADIVSSDFLRLKPMYELLRSCADVGAARLDG